MTTISCAPSPCQAARPVSYTHLTNERAAILNRIADIIDANAEHLAMIESLDNGKPIRETMAIDIPYASRHFRYFAGCIMAEEGSANILDGSTLSLIRCV